MPSWAPGAPYQSRPCVCREEKRLHLRLTVLRDSWNPADSEPQPRASHSCSSPCPCLALVLAAPRFRSASQHILQSPTLLLRPSSSVWYTQLGVKAAALLRMSETRATNTAVATSLWTVISDCQLAASLELQTTRGPGQLQHIEIGLGTGGCGGVLRGARGHHRSFLKSTPEGFLTKEMRIL